MFLTALFVLNFQPTIVHAQTTAFSYQGQLASNGVPVSGTYNLTFSLYSTAGGGSAVAGPVVTNGVIVNNGLFYVSLDFGAGVWNGQTNWLQIGVETNGAASFTTLSPRQEVLPVPYAIFANSASNLIGTLPATQLPAGVLTNNETSSVTLDNLNLNGTLNLPASVTINSGTNLLLHADNNYNFFAGLSSGNLTTSGYNNTANGGLALKSDVFGDNNTADGLEALYYNTEGSGNTANGVLALFYNSTGSENTAVGWEALFNLGELSGFGGNNNIAIGLEAGVNFNGNESSNIDIGNTGVGGESGVIRIGTPGIQTAAYIAGNLTLNGTLNLPATVVTINSGTNLLLYANYTNYNFFSGPDAGEFTTSGDFNTAIGAYALRANTGGGENAVNGAFALGNNTSGNENTANGAFASQFNQSGSYNTANGDYTLADNISGNFNTADGYAALHNIGLYSGEGGNENIALGHGAGSAFTNNEGTNIDIGNFGVAGESGVIRIGTPGVHTAAYIAGEIFGNGGGLTNISTSQFGPISLAQLPAAVVTNNETASVTLDNLTLNGTLNLPAAPVAIDSGGSPLFYANSQNFFAGLNVGTNGAQNTVIGYEAFESNTSGSRNTAFGGGALGSNTTGQFNVANGFGAMGYNTIGICNVANGVYALDASIITEDEIHSGSFNTANGYSALSVNSSGNYNVADGGYTLGLNTSGNDNTADGYDALGILGYGGAGGTNNIAIGYQAGSNFTNAESDNIDIGNLGVAGESDIIRIGTPGTQVAAYIAGNLTLNGTLNLPAIPVTINSGTNLLLYADTNLNFFSGPNAGNLTTSGRGNTAVGGTALQNNTSGASNTANGNAALYSNRSGNFNIADGAGALYFNRSGNNNTADGWGALQNLGSGNGAGGTNNIALGNSAGVAFSENESSNIDIGNTGMPGENDVIRIGTPGIQTATYLAGTVYANGVALSSDRNAKENFAAVNAQAVLEKVAALPVSEWNYKTDKKAEHIGPMAQDFHAAFGLDGTDDKHISVVDEGGVALAAIKGLNEKLEAVSTENEQLKQENNLLARRLDELEAQVKAQSEKTQ